MSQISRLTVFPALLLIFDLNSDLDLDFVFSLGFGFGFCFYSAEVKVPAKVLKCCLIYD